jgi:DNA-binding MarR family transcriptional regulator
LAIGRDVEVKTARIAAIETRARKAEWFAAMRWRRRIEATLREVRVTFTQWLVLTAAQELVEERRDAVSQKEIAARVELDEATISQVIRLLMLMDLVSIDIDMHAKATRVFLSDRGERILREYRPAVEAASRTGEGSS